MKYGTFAPMPGLDGDDLMYNVPRVFEGAGTVRQMR